jgi:predicted cytidylate kinase
MHRVQRYFSIFAHDLKSSFIDLSVIVGIVVFFQFVVLRTVPENWIGMAMGLAIVGVGLAVFMRGLQLGIFPLGEDLAHKLTLSHRKIWIVLFGFVIGFATTVAEPALIAIAQKAAVISGGQIDALVLRLIIALSVGVAIAIGVIRIILNHPIQWYIITGYVGALAITYFAPPEIVGLAYDSGGVTTSTVTVPVIAALGIGLATTLKNRNPIIDGFGLIAFASLTPMIFVQLYGIVAYSFFPVSAETISLTEHAAALAAVSHSALYYVTSFFKSVLDVLPVILTILFFYYAVLQRRIRNLQQRAIGFGFVIFGLYLFVLGLELGLFPIGESIAIELAQTGNLLLIYCFAFAIGFATTIAEPALTAISRKAQEISGGSINSTMLRVFVAVGVGTGILLGIYRIVHGDPIVWYIMIGYAFVVMLTMFSPRTIIPIAYDSGGVTTSCVTVPIVAALGLGLASTIDGRDPLIDGFGLIAFASLFPMITVLSYGIFQQENIRRHERKMQRLEDRTVARVMQSLDMATTEYSARVPKVHTRKKQIVTVAGTPGSGVSTVARLVAEKLHYQHFSTGNLFRKIAIANNISMEQLNKMAEHNEAVDHEVDHLTQELADTADKLVLDSRLAHHWIPQAFNVHLHVDARTAAKRIHAQIQSGERVAEEAVTQAEVASSIKQLIDSEHKRYLRLYGVDISNTYSFDMTLNTKDTRPETIADEIVAAYKHWLITQES